MAIQSINFQEFKNISPFIAALRTHLGTLSQDPAAYGYGGSTVFKLTPELVSSEIKRTPHLRQLYNKLAPNQRALVINRYVLNTPGSVDTFKENSFFNDISRMSPLEHDYHLTGNTNKFINSKGLQSGVARATAGFTNSPDDESLASTIFGNSLVGSLIAKAEGAFTGSNVIKEQRNKLARLRSGGLSGRQGVNELVPAPSTANQNKLLKLYEYGIPTVLDIAGTRGIAKGLGATNALVSRAAAGGNVAAKVAKPVTVASSWLGNLVHGIRNPFDFSAGMVRRFLRNPTRYSKYLFGKSKYYATTPLHPARTAKHLWRNAKRPGKAIGKILGSTEIPINVLAAADAASAEGKDSVTVSAPYAISSYLKDTKANNTKSQHSDSRPAVDKSNHSNWSDDDTKYTAGIGLAGGVLGAILSRRSRLLGFLLGSLSAGGGTALYRAYMRNKFDK